jgi:hypothetical protein
VEAQRQQTLGVILAGEAKWQAIVRHVDRNGRVRALRTVASRAPFWEPRPLSVLKVLAVRSTSPSFTHIPAASLDDLAHQASSFRFDSPPRSSSAPL